MVFIGRDSGQVSWGRLDGKGDGDRQTGGVAGR